jgi:hypothetical protein
VKGCPVNVTDPDSTAFAFLHSLFLLCQGPGWYSVRGIGRDLGLADNETRSVIQHLAARRLLEWRSGSRGWRMSDKLSLHAVITDEGRELVRTLLRHGHRAEGPDIAPQRMDHGERPQDERPPAGHSGPDSQ